MEVRNGMNSDSRNNNGSKINMRDHEKAIEKIFNKFSKDQINYVIPEHKKFIENQEKILDLLSQNVYPLSFPSQYLWFAKTRYHGMPKRLCGSTMPAHRRIFSRV